MSIGEFVVQCDLICHPDPMVGYRISSPEGVLAYLTDHEPALGLREFPAAPEWTSGYAVAIDADLLFHDCQYDDEEYLTRQGWGHSSLRQAFAFAELARVRELVTFHHDPARTDSGLDQRLEEAIQDLRPTFTVTAGYEGREFTLPLRSAPAGASLEQISGLPTARPRRAPKCDHDALTGPSQRESAPGMTPPSHATRIYIYGDW